MIGSFGKLQNNISRASWLFVKILRKTYVPLHRIDIHLVHTRNVIPPTNTMSVQRVNGLKTRLPPTD